MNNSKLHGIILNNQCVMACGEMMIDVKSDKVAIAIVASLIHYGNHVSTVGSFLK